MAAAAQSILALLLALLVHLPSCAAQQVVPNSIQKSYSKTCLTKDGPAFSICPFDYNEDLLPTLKLAANNSLTEERVRASVLYSGFYCSGSLTGLLQCQAGFVGVNDTAEGVTAIPTCPGYFSPSLVSCAFECMQGTFCPGMGIKSVSDDGNTYDRNFYNPSTYYLNEDLVHKRGLCMPYGTTPILGELCSGASAAVPCRNKYYCSSPSIRERCPKGSYCRDGAQLPEPCPAMTVCSAGTDFPVNGSIPVIALVSGFILVLVLIKLAFVVRMKSNAKEEIDSQQGRVPRGGIKSTEHSQRGLPPEGRPEVDFPLSIQFDSLRLELKKTKIPVLQGVNGACEAGRVTAVMGPSGAGKTSFLSALSGKARAYGDITGTILVNGQPDKISNFKDITGFVPQEDVMNRELTVREILSFNAAFRLPSSLSESERKKKVDHVLHTLDLWAIRNKQIGDEKKRGISGGQRKRVNIGMELVADPSLLLLDEPTSGLDSTCSQNVMETLRLSSTFGVNVVVVLHQPRYEIFRMFTDVLLLGKGGRAVYVGPTSKVLDYFECLGFELPPLVNPADFYMDVIGGDVAPVRNPPTLSPAAAERRARLLSAQPKGSGRSNSSGSGSGSGSGSNGSGTGSRWWRWLSGKPTSGGAGGGGAGGDDDAGGASLAGEDVEFGGDSARQRLLSSQEMFEVEHVSQPVVDKEGWDASMLFDLWEDRSNWLNNGAYSANLPGSVGFQAPPPPVVLSAHRGICARCHAPLEYTPSAISPTPVRCYACPHVTVFAIPEAAAIVQQQQQQQQQQEQERRSHLQQQQQAQARKHTKRRLPNVFVQTVLCAGRGLRQLWRSQTTVFADTMTLVLAGGLIAIFLLRPGMEKIISVNFMILFSVGLTSITQSLRVFGDERTIFYRESSVGLNRFAYFVGKNISSLPHILVGPLLFLSFFFPLMWPRGDFSSYYIIVLITMWCTHGLGQVISLSLDRGSHTIVAVLCVIICSVLCGSVPTVVELKHMQFVTWPSYARWSFQALFYVEFNSFPESFAVEIQEIQNKYGFHPYDFDWQSMVLVNFGLGLFLRLVALLCLLFLGRKKQL